MDRKDGSFRQHKEEANGYHARTNQALHCFCRRGRSTWDEARLSAALTAPDLVVEIISPSDRAGQVLDKVHDWLRAGVQLLWYINPDTGDTTVYQGDRVSHVAADEVLDGGDLLPGFQVQIGSLLHDLREEMA
ncbi:MAG TPA: Uma2 family endonuclease [Chloroflexota bacterium]